MRKLILCAISLFAFVATAQASPAVFNWTGFYAGVHAGYGWGHSVHDFGAGFANNVVFDSALAGGLIGYNWQLSRTTVIGIETDVSWVDLSGSIFTGAFTSGTNVNWYGTTRLRLGYALDNMLLFVAGGVAYGEVERSDLGPFATSFRARSTEVGWTIGAGLEFALARNWSLRAEYLFVDLGEAAFAAPPPFASNTVDAEFHVVRAALNYRF